MPTRIWMTEIFETVAKRYGMTPGDLKRHTNEREFVEPRQVAVYLCRQLTGITRPALGRFLGQHHTTILHGEQKIKSLRAEKPELDALIMTLIAELSALRAA